MVASPTKILQRGTSTEEILWRADAFRQWMGLGFLAGVIGFTLMGWSSVGVGSGMDTAGFQQFPEGSFATAGSFTVRDYVIEGNLLLATNLTAQIFAKHEGEHISLRDIAETAMDLQTLYIQNGYTTVTIVISPERIQDGKVPLTVFQGAMAQIVIAGQQFPSPSVGLAAGAHAPGEMAGFVPPPTAPTASSNLVATASLTATNVAAVPPIRFKLGKPATAAEMAQARAELIKKLTTPDDTRIHVVSTNAGPHFPVQHYLVRGNTVLSSPEIAEALTNIDGAYGTNVSLDGIKAAVTELQKAYTERGYVTVSVGLPEQKLTNATVQIKVLEGRLSSIEVKGNHYFSSNNVMRALPSLHTNMVLNSRIFQAELNRANANQDRQIYPVVGPGPEPGTSALTLKVKDQLPLHAKEEFNNDSSPGTPALRLNSSAVYNNLWQLEHSLGLQYSFSPEEFKQGPEWNTYDRPLVANYSFFYRMPLGGPKPIADEIADKPGSFGYNEATRKFNLPPASGQPELNVYGSRSTIDTGLQTLSDETLSANPNDALTVKNVQQGITFNNDLGFRISTPLVSRDTFHSDLSFGADFKMYRQSNYKTNEFFNAQIPIDPVTLSNLPPIYSTNLSGIPKTIEELHYVPLAIRYDAGWKDLGGSTELGLGLSFNSWYSGTTTTNGILSLSGRNNLQGISGSAKTTGYWVILTPSLSREFNLGRDWVLTLRGNGQWSDQPLISNEQFGLGGVNSVRGYREGEVFGDNGWQATLEQATPTHLVGMIHGNIPLTIRGIAYTDYGKVYLIDPQGQQSPISLWGAGIGGMASAGSHWQARVLVSVPLLSDATTEQYEPFVNFSLTAQF